MPMAQYLLLRGWLVLLTTSVRCGLPIFLKVNHQLESRMREIRQSGSEGGAKLTFVPTPILAQAIFSVLRAFPAGNVLATGHILFSRISYLSLLTGSPSFS
jgi:hypothetical protein